MGEIIAIVKIDTRSERTKQFNSSRTSSWEQEMTRDISHLLCYFPIQRTIVSSMQFRRGPTFTTVNSRSNKHEESILGACSYEKAHSVSSTSAQNASGQWHLFFSFGSLSAPSKQVLNTHPKKKNCLITQSRKANSKGTITQPPIVESNIEFPRHIKYRIPVHVLRIGWWHMSI